MTDHHVERVVADVLVVGQECLKEVVLAVACAS